ncbi:MAG: exodeoxyribonuclease VII small subunit [Clostridia bacterium]|nr:exodeoxyribonuclease VII small subunit [Clostridia bacterium]
MNFEALLKELEVIVAKLENPNTTLDEGIELFNKGIGISKTCMAVLTESKGKISLLKFELDKITSEEFCIGENE